MCNIESEFQKMIKAGEPDPKKNWTLVLTCVNGSVSHYWRAEVYKSNTGSVSHMPGENISPVEAVEKWANFIKNEPDYINVFGVPKGEDKPERIRVNGKAVFVLNERQPEISAESFTVGKVYEFVDGVCIDDDGEKRPGVVAGRTYLDDPWFKKRFVLIKE